MSGLSHRSILQTLKAGPPVVDSGVWPRESSVYRGSHRCAKRGQQAGRRRRSPSRVGK